jgi:hypothetical protein
MGNLFKLIFFKQLFGLSLFFNIFALLIRLLQRDGLFFTCRFVSDRYENIYQIRYKNTAGVAK